MPPTRLPLLPCLIGYGRQAQGSVSFSILVRERAMLCCNWPKVSKQLPTASNCRKIGPPGPGFIARRPIAGSSRFPAVCDQLPLVLAGLDKSTV